jgi:hypothetical protein
MQTVVMAIILSSPSENNVRKIVINYYLSKSRKDN